MYRPFQDVQPIRERVGAFVMVPGRQGKKFERRLAVGQKIRYNPEKDVYRSSQLFDIYSIPIMNSIVWLIKAEA